MKYGVQKESENTRNILINAFHQATIAYNKQSLTPGDISRGVEMGFFESFRHSKTISKPTIKFGQQFQTGMTILVAIALILIFSIL